MERSASFAIHGPVRWVASLSHVSKSIMFLGEGATSRASELCAAGRRLQAAKLTGRCANISLIVWSTAKSRRMDILRSTSHREVTTTKCTFVVPLSAGCDVMLSAQRPPLIPRGTQVHDSTGPRIQHKAYHAHTKRRRYKNSRPTHLMVFYLRREVRASSWNSGTLCIDSISGVLVIILRC